MSKIDQINIDELNCPCCAGQHLMEFRIFTSNRVPDGVSIECPGCGFQVAGHDPAYLEAVIRLAWDWYPLVNEIETDWEE